MKVRKKLDRAADARKVVMQSDATELGEWRFVLIFNRNGEENRGDEEVIDRFGIQDRYEEGQMLADRKVMEMAAVNTFFGKRQEYR